MPPFRLGLTRHEFAAVAKIDPGRKSSSTNIRIEESVMSHDEGPSSFEKL